MQDSETLEEWWLVYIRYKISTRQTRQNYILNIVKSMFAQYGQQQMPQPINTQLYNHPVASFPQSYVSGSPLASLGYNYPGNLMQYPSTATMGTAQFPAGYGPGLNGIIPTSNNMYVTSGPGYTSPKPSVSLRNSNVGTGSVVGATGPLMGVGQTTINTVGAGLANRAALHHQQIAQNTIGLQGFSQIQYIPYESYYIDYEQRQFVQNVMVPVQKKITDYYAVEHVVDYVPKEIQQTVVEYIPEQRTSNKLFYVPVETKLVHLPHHQQEHRVNQQVTTQTVVAPQITQQQNVVVTGQERVISRPVQQVLPKQEIIQGLPTQIQQGVIRTASPAKVPLQTTTVQTTQSPPLIQTGVISQPIISKAPGPALQTTTTITGQPPLVGGNQFMQSRMTQQKTWAQIQQQRQIPDNAKVQYQYSTKTVRNLSPGQLPGAKQTTVGQTTLTRPTGQIIQGQPIPGTAPTLVNRTVASQLNSNRLPSQPSNQNPIPTQSQPQGSAALMKNNKVDLADSEHIDITKSVFNATYGDPNKANQLPLAQGMMTGTNPAVYAGNSSISQGSNTFSFGNRASQNGSNVISSLPGNVNKLTEAQANRISGGSVYDYDQLREY